MLCLPNSMELSVSEKQDRALQRAFERGQQDWRDGNERNPYPLESPYRDYWEQGWEAEKEIEQK